MSPTLALAFGCCLGLVIAAPARAAIALVPDTVTAPAAAQVRVPIIANLNGDAPDTLLIQLAFDTALATAVDLLNGPGAPGKLMDVEPNATGATLLIFGGPAGGITDGAVMAELVLALDAGAAGQSIQITDDGSSATNVSVEDLEVAVTTGTVNIAANIGHHTADINASWRISLSELLRVIQFYNIEALSCQGGTEDGYTPGSGDQSCTPHDSDYQSVDWSISLSELLRLIQLYNASVTYHAETGTEDGYAVGPF
jgi:hypothetical protein